MKDDNNKATSTSAGDGTGTGSGGVSSETNERICNHMNNDHAVSIYAMAKQQLMINTNPSNGSSSSSKHITEAKLTNVTLDGCTIKVITCSGDFCQQHKILYPFVPPKLTSSNELRSKMVQIHHNVTRPHPLLIIKHQPIAIVILFGIGMLLYGTILQYQGESPQDDDSSILNMILYSKICPIVFWLTVLAHCYEMLHTLYYSRFANTVATVATTSGDGGGESKKPFLSWKNTILWCIVVFIGGFPFWNEFNDLLKYYKEHDNKEQKKR